MKVVLVTGASSGMGFHAAQMLAQKGYKVYAAARRLELMEPLRSDGVVPMQMDVTIEQSISQVVSTIVEQEGRIDVLINNAGYGSLGAVEDVPMDEARRQIEVNLFGLASLTRHVLPYMRKNKSGLVINIGSVAGRMPLHLGAWYNVSKYSVRALSESMRMELKPFGIKVVLIEPGPILTAWGSIAADNLEQSSANGVYAEQAAETVKGYRSLYSSHWPTKPEQVARLMVKIVEAKRPRRRYPVGKGARAMLFFHALLPQAWFEKISTSAFKKL